MDSSARRLSLDRARARLETIAARERADPLIDPDNVTKWWLHDEPVDRVVLAMHGYTNCPKQYDALGPLLHADGHNVIALRFPYHGYRDRMSTDIARMRYPDWAAPAIEALTIAFDAGARVVTLGISVAATIAAWLAAYFPVHVGIAVSPFVAVRGVSGRANVLLNAAMRTLPDQFVWWDPIHKQNELPLHAYPRFSLHTLASTMAFGETLASFQSDAHGRRVLLVLNEREPIVNNRVARQRFASLTERNVAVETLVRGDFPPRHDVLEPTIPNSPDPNVYGLLRELVATR
jgi:carboxylesterase